MTKENKAKLCAPRLIHQMHKLGYIEKKKKLGWQAKKGSNLCKKTWGIQPWHF